MLPPKNEVVKDEEEHTCKDCGMVFERKYALIMHGLKHNHKEFKCPVSATSDSKEGLNIELIHLHKYLSTFFLIWIILN